MYYLINENNDIIGESRDTFPTVAPLRLVLQSEWQPDPEKALLSRKQARIQEAAASAQTFIERAAGLDAVPPFERESYPAQAAEAQAWAADRATPTPILDGIAKARGVPPDILREKALAKALAFSALTASVAGQRQAYEDRIKAAQTLAELDALTFAWHIPMMPVTPTHTGSQP